MKEYSSAFAKNGRFMLKDFPIYFDDTRLLWLVKRNESYEVMESKNTTEAGTDQIIVTRYDMLSVSDSFQCSDK